MEIPKNRGVIVEPLNPRLWVAGQETGIAYEVKVPNGNWGKYLPKVEEQFSPGFDTLSCVTFSGLNTIEMQMNKMLAQEEFTLDELTFLQSEGYIDDNGKINFSDRFSAIMDGTTRNGNYMSNLPDSAARDGLLPERDLPFPNLSGVKGTAKRSEFTEKWNAYHDPIAITVEMKEKAKRFLDHFDIRYEVVAYGAFDMTPTNEIRKHLKHAPLHFAGPVCPTVGKVEFACGIKNAQHARVIYAIDDAFRVFDSYKVETDRLSLAACVPYVYKIIVRSKRELPVVPFHYVFKNRLVPIANDPTFRNPEEDVMALQKALQQLGFMNREIIPVGFFGPKTKEAVIKFQVAFNVATPGEIRMADGIVGPKTRAALTDALA